MPIHGGFMVHVKAKCQKGKDCQGPGCKLRTGKTRLKAGRPGFRGWSLDELSR